MKSKIKEELEKLVNQELNELKLELEKEYPNKIFEVKRKVLLEIDENEHELLGFDSNRTNEGYLLFYRGKQYLKQEKNEITVIKQKPKTVWDLEFGDTYYSIDKSGYLCPLVWEDDLKLIFEVGE